MNHSKDIQRDKWQITINNPADHKMTHDKIKATFMQNFKTLEYFCMADEKGSCYHTHIFVTFSSRVRFSKIKKHFPMAHIEACKGSVSDNIDYIKKSGKWENDKKHGTQIKGTYEESGTPPPDIKGTDEAYRELFEMIQNGYNNIEILTQNTDYIRDIDKLDKVRTMILTERYKGTRRTDMQVTYISGVTGTGKTSSVLDEFGDANVYRVTDYDHPFDGYNCQSILLLDEFRSSLRIKDMLNFLDIYPLELPARYANKYACYEKVFIISNWTLEKQYSEVQKEDKESWDAFLRRIHKVKVFNSKTDIRTYDSVAEYMNRKEEFIKVTEEEEKEIESVFS